MSVFLTSVRSAQSKTLGSRNASQLSCDEAMLAQCLAVPKSDPRWNYVKPPRSPPSLKFRSGAGNRHMLS